MGRGHTKRGVHQYALLFALLIVSGCGETTTPTPDRAAAPTLGAPEWRETSAPIRLDTVPAISYLGRLDQDGAAATVFAHAVSPDGLSLVGLTNDAIIVWDLLTGDRIFSNARLDTVQVMFSSDKTEIFGIDSGGDLRVIDAANGRDLYRALGHTAYANVWATAPDHDLIALGGTDGTIKIWDMIRRESRITFGGGAAITALVFSADGSRLAAADGDGWLRVYTWETSTPLLERQSSVLGTTRLLAHAVAFSPDAEQLAVAMDQTVELVAMTNTPTRALTVGGYTQFATYSADGAVIAAGVSDSGISLWSTVQAQRIATLPNTSGSRVDGDFSPDGTMIVTTSVNQPPVLWNVAAMTQQSGGAFEIPIESRTILEVEWTDDGRLILLFDANGAIYAWGIP